MPNEVKSPLGSIVVTSIAHVNSIAVFVTCISVLELATSEPHIGTLIIMGVKLYILDNNNVKREYKQIC